MAPVISSSLPRGTIPLALRLGAMSASEVEGTVAAVPQTLLDAGTSLAVQKYHLGFTSVYERFPGVPDGVQMLKAIRQHYFVVNLVVGPCLLGCFNAVGCSR